jgi:hypothetical protein
MELEERAADPLAGGLMRGYQCGMVWGAALAAGAQAYRLFGTGPQAEARAVIAAQRIVASFRAQNDHIDCREITGIDMVSSPSLRIIASFLIKSAATGSCFGMAARCAKAAFGEINAALSENRIEAPPAPVSCSAMLTQKMGASDIHAVMAAGLAGGIGFSGSACGALGATIWIIGMNVLKDGGTLGLKVPGALEAIERFTKCTGDEFECSKIVGRKFESVDDHARYVRDGGCSKIIEVLATQES